jgi:hypothetical protein
LAGGDEQLQPLLGIQLVLVAEIGNRNALGRPKMMPAIWAL